MVRDHRTEIGCYLCTEKGHGQLPGQTTNKSEFYSHWSPLAEDAHLVVENILSAVKLLVSVSPLPAAWVLLYKSLAEKQINLSFQGCLC